MHCPHCGVDLNDAVPECPDCKFHIRQVDQDLGEPPPRPVDGVGDLASLLTSEGKGRIRDRIEMLKARTEGVELLVITVPTSRPRKPSEHVFWLFNRWDVGGEANRGVLILLAKEERRIEVEVGFGLESIITDAACGAILEAHAVPFFRRERFDDGLFHAVDVTARVLEGALIGSKVR